MSYTEFNINYCVKVKLTKTGIDELKRQHEELNDSFPNFKTEFKLNIDEEGYTKCQMHHLMEQLGHLCTMGSELPFHPNILIESETK